MEKYKEQFIEFMVESGVLQFGDFVTKSGRRTPFFINTGYYRTGEQLKKLGEFYAEAIADRFGTDFDILFGPAYKGIPLSVTTAIALSAEHGADVRYCSNRKEIKDHGDKGILLGSPIRDHDRIVMIEDVTTAGTSIRETMPILKAQGDVQVIGLIVSVDRMERGTGKVNALTEIAGEYGMKTAAIVTMAEVVSYLKDHPVGGKYILDETILKAIEGYYEQYGGEA